MSSAANKPFDVQVDEWIKGTHQQLDDAYRATALLALARVQQLTPVRTGRLRAAWTISLTAEPTREGNTDLARTLQDLRAGEPYYIVNPTVYAMRIEYGFVGTDSLGRHYNEKGRHMMEQTIQEMPQIARTATQWVMSGQSPYTVTQAPVAP